MKRDGKWPWKEGRWRAFRNIPTFWAHQRTTNLDKSELLFHLALNLIGVIVLYSALTWLHVFSSAWTTFWISLVLARTASWVLNDHFWGGLQVSFTPLKNRGSGSFTNYLKNSAERLAQANSITSCLVYGSLTRGKFHRKSDLDVLYIRKPGLINAASALAFAARERVISLFTRIPLDLYVGDSINAFKKYRADEIPVIVKDDSGVAANWYSKWIPLETFLQDFGRRVNSVEIRSTKARRPTRVCLICSVGGHFKQMLKLADAWRHCEHFYVLMHKPVIDSFCKKERVFLVTSPERSPMLFLRNIFESLIIFLRMRPDVVISTGAGVAIAMCYIAKLFGKKVIYVEDWCIVERPSVTGRAVYPIADLFIVQREHLKAFYPNAVFGGELF